MTLFSFSLIFFKNLKQNKTKGFGKNKMKKKLENCILQEECTIAHIKHLEL